MRPNSGAFSHMTSDFVGDAGAGVDQHHMGWNNEARGHDDPGSALGQIADAAVIGVDAFVVDDLAAENDALAGASTTLGDRRQVRLVRVSHEQL